MNFTGCANCLLHGWKQVENLNTLQRCTKCKLIQYCGRDCQAEHWKRIHKKQCRYFADPAKAQKWGHNEEVCAICIQTAQVGKARICRAENLNYECILKEKFPPFMYHPHPFPVTGEPGQTYEKALIILWQLLKKFELTQPGVISSCQGKLVKVFAELKLIRLDIWKYKKIFGQTENYAPKMFPHSFEDLLNTIKEKVGSVESVEDPFQFGKIIRLVDQIIVDVYLDQQMQVLIDPLADIPADLHKIVWGAMSNSGKYLTMANKVLDALANQVVPYQDLVKMVCGGSPDKRCNFCQKNTTITTIDRICGRDPSVFFGWMMMDIYCCGTPNCRMTTVQMMQDYMRIEAAVLTTVSKRVTTHCDFCLKLPPGKGGHRCSKCLAVLYCSTDCRDQDREIHKEFCKEEVEERKKKVGSSGRRQEAKGGVERMEKVVEKMVLEESMKGRESALFAQNASEVVGKFKLKK